MKETLSQIENVKKAQDTLGYLITRPRSEMVGLGLIYGAPGLGKTRFAMRTAFSKGYIYLRLDATMTQRSFLTKLLQSLQYLYSVPAPIKGGKQKLYQDVVEILISAPDTVIFVDEIDYAFRDKGLLGTIRDLVDETLVTIILVGMQDAKNALLKANAHYFDRCNAFVEFKPLSKDDTALIVKEASEVKMDPEVIAWLYSGTKGTARKLVKMIDLVERKAAKAGKKQIGMGDIHE